MFFCTAFVVYYFLAALSAATDFTTIMQKDDYMLETATAYLIKDELHHIDMLEPLRKNSAELVAACTQGVLLYLPESEVHLLSARTRKAAMELVAQAGEITMMTVHQSVYLPDLEEKYGFKRSAPSFQAAYFSKEPLPLYNPSLTVRPLGIAYLDFVIRNYEGPVDNAEYFAERLNAEAIYGGFLEGEPVGFVGVHSEGSIGFLQVLPAYRRQKIAATLSAFIINQFLANGLVPYGQVLARNKPSLELQKSLGLEVSPHKLYWLDPPPKNPAE